MGKYSNTFYGQHEDERVLYTIRPYALVVGIQIAKFLLAGLAILISFTVISSQIPLGNGIMMTLGLVMALLIGGGGVLATMYGQNKNVGYITDRRIIRFQADNPWSMNSRSLTWEEAVKVKTYPPNLWWRLLNIGTVVVHAKSTILNTEEPKTKNYVSEDDINLNDVYYYRDLGNYIDKILYLYHRKSEDLDSLKPFVLKPKGKRD